MDLNCQKRWPRSFCKRFWLIRLGWITFVRHTNDSAMLQLFWNEWWSIWLQSRPRDYSNTLFVVIFDYRIITGLKRRLDNAFPINSKTPLLLLFYAMELIKRQND